MAGEGWAGNGGGNAKTGFDDPADDSGEDPDVTVDPKKWDYIFGRVTSGSHNTPRSAQNGAQLARIGIHDTPDGRQTLTEFFKQQFAGNDNIVEKWSNQYGDYETREGLLSGPGGFVNIQSSWEITPNGYRLTTIIPRGGP